MKNLGINVDRLLVVVLSVIVIACLPIEFGRLLVPEHILFVQWFLGLGLCAGGLMVFLVLVLALVVGVPELIKYIRGGKND